MPSNRITLASAILGFLIALVGILVWFNTQGSDPSVAGQSGVGSVAVALWWGGAFFLAIAIIYGILNNRTRGPASRRASEQATKANYAAENRAERSASTDR